MTRNQEMNAEITTLKGAVEANLQATQERFVGLEQRLGTIETNMTGMMASLATISAAIQNLEKAQGKKLEEPTSSEVTTPHQTPIIIQILNCG